MLITHRVGAQTLLQRLLKTCNGARLRLYIRLIGKFDLATKHQEERTEACSGMNARIISQAELTNVMLPISLEVANCCG